MKKLDELIESFMFYIQEKESMVLLKLLIKSLLSTKKCIYKYRFTKIIFNHVIELIKDKIFKSFIQPGESVGIIVEQSYYEELQQATLKYIPYSWYWKCRISRCRKIFRNYQCF